MQFRKVKRPRTRVKFKSRPVRHGLNEDEIYDILNTLDQNKITITNNIIQLLYNKGFFQFVYQQR